jgi:hypothetical protein
VLCRLGWCRERGYEGPTVPARAKRLAVPDSETPARSKMAIDRLIARREVHARACRYFKPSPEAIAELTSLLAPGGSNR